jgi:hypothetical protein
MINNPQNNKFSNKYQQSATANKWSAQKKQAANSNKEIDEDSNSLKGCLVHLCGLLGFCFLASGLVSDGDRVPIIFIPVIKAILFLFFGNQTLCLILGAVLLLIYGIFYFLYKDIYFKKDEENGN